MEWLSKGGRVTMLRVVLHSLLTYYCLLFKIPKNVVEWIETNMKGFLWSMFGEDKLMSLIG
ncbi:hypothetical protein Scep_012606 [Stephania cephalantha]|uniref:Uncharacterized protein n=1 Tax=Stephania cephalantha TaxID=152367 RepID=A0AAP0JFG0_9MAGN